MLLFAVAVLCRLLLTAGVLHWLGPGQRSAPGKSEVVLIEQPPLVRWSEGSHKVFPAAFRASVSAFLACHTRLLTQNARCVAPSGDHTVIWVGAVRLQARLHLAEHSPDTGAVCPCRQGTRGKEVACNLGDIPANLVWPAGACHPMCPHSAVFIQAPKGFVLMSTPCELSLVHGGADPQHSGNLRS